MTGSLHEVHGSLEGDTEMPGIVGAVDFSGRLIHWEIGRDGE